MKCCAIAWDHGLLCAQQDGGERQVSLRTKHIILTDEHGNDCMYEGLTLKPTIQPVLEEDVQLPRFRSAQSTISPDDRSRFAVDNIVVGEGMSIRVWRGGGDACIRPMCM